jgi:hypothetical protein
MSPKEQELEWLRQKVEAYLQNCAPVHWLNWASKCPDLSDKKLIESVLFANGHLRDLTDAGVKAEVLKVFSQSAAMMQLVIAELAEEVRTHTRKESTSS